MFREPHDDEIKALNGRTTTAEERLFMRQLIRSAQLACLIGGCNCSPEIGALMPEVGRPLVEDGRQTLVTMAHEPGCPMRDSDTLTSDESLDFLQSFDQMNQDGML